MPKTVFIDATWEGTIELGTELFAELKRRKTKTVALFAAVQFLNLDRVRQQLQNASITVLTTKAKRTHVSTQILGCDAYEDSFEDDIITQADSVLYIGDGLFHPKALLLAQLHATTIKDVIIWDPVAKTMRIIRAEDVVAQKKKTIANIKRFIAAERIGIIVTIKPGQQYIGNAEKLQEQLQKQNKEVYIFIDNTVNLFSLENYPFIQAWVNTACPRIGMDDITTIPQALINIRDAYDPVAALERLE